MNAKKKDTKQTADGATYDVGDVVLAKVRGYPPWPGMIVNPESVPTNVTQARPQSKKMTFYCVRFFPIGDYVWTVPKDMSKLQKPEIEAYINEPFRKNGELLKGYKVALDPTKWEEEREQVLREEAHAEVDQLDEGEEEEEGGAPGKKKKAAESKKRKRDSEPAVKKEPKAKAAKKEPVQNKKGAATSKRNRAVVEQEDEDAGDEEKPSPPATKKSKSEVEEDDALANDEEAQKVRQWRYALQKAFLGNASLADKAMPGLDKLFTKVEQYDNMTTAYLQYSKIIKVLRHIYQQDKNKIPRDGEFKFKERAQALVDKWQSILNAHEVDGTSKSEDKDDGAADMDA